MSEYDLLSLSRNAKCDFRSLGHGLQQIEMSRRLRVALTDGTMPHLLSALGEALFRCAAEVKAWQKMQSLSLVESVSKGVINIATAPSREDVEAQQARMAHDRQQVNEQTQKIEYDPSKLPSHGHHKGN